ncbi:hypothetical protein FDENT_1353 [Fusarium denticulatum]|uniref:Uncharacterized protein n=1 Tax=Fusarium denticulatum TaxID=48507 RepID=A0A8H6CVW4_9HYPO|nr:hypothetical protein FDENT_1353 [Fusarium denticulatum]
MSTSVHVAARRFWAHRQQTVHGGNDCAGDNFAWRPSMDIARVPARRPPEAGEKHRPGGFDDAAYDALRHIREGAQIPDPDFDGGPAGAPLVDPPGEGGNVFQRWPCCLLHCSWPSVELSSQNAFWLTASHLTQ